MKLYSAQYRDRRGERGYILIVLLLACALLAIAMGAAVTNFRKSIQREKEVEAIHRGVQYARAIKVFYRKFGRYPNSVDQLINTNNLRFLRRKYSDPLSPDGKWRVLHPQDIKLFGAGGGLGLGGGGMPNIPGSPFGNTPQGGTGGTFSLFGSNQQTSGGTGSSSQQGGPGSTSQPIGGAIETVGGKDSSSSSSAFNTGQTVMGGGPVVGVASLRNENGIHTFNQKANYRDWQFIFNPQTDLDRQITGPYNPNAFVGKSANPLGKTGSPATSTQNTPTQPQQPAPQPNPQQPTPQAQDQPAPQ